MVKVALSVEVVGTMNYSYSRLDTYKKCPRKYAYKYLEKPDIEKRASIEAYLGTTCHNAIQQVYRDLALSKRMSLEEVLAFYENEWDKRRPDNLRIVRERYTEGHYRETGRRYVQDFYAAHAPFEDGRTIGVEKDVYINIRDGYMLVGRIDRLVDHGKGCLEVIDYKTDRNLPSLQDLEQNWQLPLYHLGLQQMFPEVTDVKCTWYYLAHGKSLSLRRTQEDLDRLKGDVLALIGTIESVATFEPNPTALCSWCDYEAICPARKHLFAVASLPPEEFLKDDGVSLVDAYLAVKQEMSDADVKKEALKERIYAYAQQHSVSVIRGSQQQIKVWSKEKAAKLVSKDEDPAAFQAALEILKKHGLLERFSNFSTISLQRAIDHKEISGPVLEELRPYLRFETVRQLYPGKLQE